MPHKHYREMMQYAEDAATHDRPWEFWEYKPPYSDAWVAFSSFSPSWSNEYKYRRKTKTININGFDVPEPVRSKPDMGTICFSVRFNSAPLAAPWLDSYIDNELLNIGFLHFTEESARIHSEALVSFTKRKD